MAWELPPDLNLKRGGYDPPLYYLEIKQLFNFFVQCDAQNQRQLCDGIEMSGQYILEKRLKIYGSAYFAYLLTN